MAKMGRAPQRQAAAGVAPPLLLLLSIMLFCKPLLPGTSLITFLISQTTRSLICVFHLWIPVMEVGHIAAYGSYAEGAGGMTDLQKHVSFFDSNGDGVVSINETYNGELLVSSPFQSFVHPLHYVCCDFFCYNHLVTFGHCVRFRNLGFRVAMSTASATFINGAFAGKTRPVKPPTLPTLFVIMYVLIQLGGKRFDDSPSSISVNFVSG
jgi:hypothetical protein